MSQEKKIVKFQRTTQEQLDFYVTFLRNHPELISTRTDPATSSVVRKLWNEIANNLNAMKGPTRSAFKWKATMAQWRHQLRCRARKNARVHKTKAKNSVRSKTYEQVLDETQPNKYTNKVKDLPTLGLKEILAEKVENSATLLDFEEIIPKEEIENSSSPTPDFQNSDAAFEFEFTKIEEDSNMDFIKDIEEETSIQFAKTQQIEDSNTTHASSTQITLTPTARLLATEPTIKPTTDVRKKNTTTGNVLNNIVTIIEKREQWEQKYREDNLKTQRSLARAMRTLGKGMECMGEAIKSLNESILLVKQRESK